MVAGQSEPDPPECPVVAELLEDGNRLRGQRQELLRSSLLGAAEPQVRELGAGPQLGPPVAFRDGRRDRRLEEPFGIRKLTAPPDDEPELGEQVAVRELGRLDERHCPCEQVLRGGHVAALGRAQACRGQARAGIGRELRRVTVRRPELDEVAVGLLQVVADQLLRAIGAAASSQRAKRSCSSVRWAFGTVPYAASWIRTWWKRNRPGRSGSGRTRVQQALLDSREQPRVDGRRLVFRRASCDDGLARELAPRHRGALQHRQLAGGSSMSRRLASSPSSEGGASSGSPPSAACARSCSMKSGLPPAVRRIRVAELVRDLGDVLDQRLAVLARERREPRRLVAGSSRRAPRAGRAAPGRAARIGAADTCSAK